MNLTESAERALVSMGFMVAIGLAVAVPAFIVGDGIPTEELVLGVVLVVGYGLVTYAEKPRTE